MTDEEIEKLYEKTQRAYLVDTGTFDPELREGDLAHDYWYDVGKLLAEVKWQHRALEIARALAGTSILCQDMEGLWTPSCPLCSGGDHRTDADGRWEDAPEHPIDGKFFHEPECPVTKARSLLADRGEP